MYNFKSVYKLRLYVNHLRFSFKGEWPLLACATTPDVAECLKQLLRAMLPQGSEIQKHLEAMMSSSKDKKSNDDTNDDDDDDDFDYDD